MNRVDLIEIVAARTDSSKIATTRIVDGFLAAVQQALLNGDKVSLSGFGSFECVSVRARKRRNPQTGNIVLFEATTRPRFTPSTVLLEQLSVGGDPSSAL